MSLTRKVPATLPSLSHSSDPYSSVATKKARLFTCVKDVAFELALPGLTSNSVGVKEGSKRSSSGSVRSTTDVCAEGYRPTRRLRRLLNFARVMVPPFWCGQCLAPGFH